MRLLIIFFLFILVSSCYVGEELPPDQEVWEYGHPSEGGLSAEELLSIDSAIQQNFYEAITGLIIIKNDRLVFENYYGLSERGRLKSIGEASLVFTVTAIGIAQDLGLLTIDDPIHQYLPSYSSSFFGEEVDVRKRDITIRQLLVHRSGFAWNESVAPIFDNPDNNLNQMFASADWIEFILERPLDADPGLRYNFNSGTGSILAKIVENASNQSFDGFLRDKLFNAINIDHFFISTDPIGNFDGGRGISVSLIDWSKFGYLMVNGGIWNGRRVVDPNFVEEATTLQTELSPWFNIGYGWTFFGSIFENVFPFDVNEFYFTTGSIGQHLYVIPSHDMIVAIDAENFFFDFINPSLNLFAQITTAIQEVP